MRHACAYASVVWKRVGYYGTIEVLAGTLQPVHSEVDNNNVRSGVAVFLITYPRRCLDALASIIVKDSRRVL
jgi:hypothetical protein